MSESVYIKIVADQFSTVSNLVNQISDATGLQADRIKPDRGQFVAFLSGVNERVGVNKFLP
jgi:hypothetical protein